MEVPFEDYKKEEQDKDRRKYLHKQARENREISYNSLDSDEINGEELIRDTYTDVEQNAITRILIAKLRKALTQLTEDELELIEALYYQGQNERRYAAYLGISQKGVNKRRHKVLNKLRNLVDKI